MAAAALALLLALLGSAAPAGAQDAGARALVDRVIAAAGGMQGWAELKDVTFKLTSVSLTPEGEATGARVSLYRLKRHGKIRIETVTGGGVLVQAFDGQRPWVTLGGKPDTSPEALTRAHFQSVNWWYWIGIPFKLKDPGVIVRHAGAAALQGKRVEVLEVTFEPKIGATSDRYTYYIDPETHHIVFVELQLQPGVWPGVGGPAPSRSAWLEYKNEGPFTIHTKRVFYDSADLTTKRGIAWFEEFRFNTGLPDSLFRGP